MGMPFAPIRNTLKLPCMFLGHVPYMWCNVQELFENVCWSSPDFLTKEPNSTISIHYANVHPFSFFVVLQTMKFLPACSSLYIFKAIIIITINSRNLLESKKHEVLHFLGLFLILAELQHVCPP